MDLLTGSPEDVLFVGLALSMPLIAYIGMERFGRRKMLSTILLVVGGLCFLKAIIYDRGLLNSAVTATVWLLIGSAYLVTFVYTTEMYPTVVRSIGFCFGATASRFGTIAADYNHEWATTHGTRPPNLLLGFITFVSGVCVSWLPETKYMGLPEIFKAYNAFEFVALPVTVMHHKKKLSGTSSPVSYWSSLNLPSRLSYLPFSRVPPTPQTHPRHRSATHHDHTKQAMPYEPFPQLKKLFADAPTEETKAQQIVDKSRLLPSMPTQVDQCTSSTTPISPSLPLGAQFISSVPARSRSAAEQSPLRQPHSPNQPLSKPLAVVPSSSILMTAKATVMPSKSNKMTGQAKKHRKRKRRQTTTPTTQPLTPTGVELPSEVGALNTGRPSDEAVNHEAEGAAPSGQPNSSKKILRKRPKTQ